MAKRRYCCRCAVKGDRCGCGREISLTLSGDACCARPRKNPLIYFLDKGVFDWVSLTMTYFHEDEPHYHRRVCVSRSCSGWEGVVPQSYGRQTLTVIECFWSLDIGRSVCCVIVCIFARCLFWALRRVSLFHKVIGSSPTGN